MNERQRQIDIILNGLELGDSGYLGPLNVTRVPGGWVYYIGGGVAAASVFVPFAAATQDRQMFEIEKMTLEAEAASGTD